MISIINERQITEEQQEMLELEAQIPEKFDHEFEFKLNSASSDKKKENRYKTYTMEETAALLAASKAPTDSTPVPQHKDPYPPGPYPQEWIDWQQQLIKEHFEYKDKERKKREEREQWENSLKMGEFAIKTTNTTKPISSTKTSKHLATQTKK